MLVVFSRSRLHLHHENDNSLMFEMALTVINTPNSKSMERAWSRGIVDRTEEHSFVLSTMPRLHARSRLLELGVLHRPFTKEKTASGIYCVRSKLRT